MFLTKKSARRLRIDPFLEVFFSKSAGGSPCNLHPWSIINGCKIIWTHFLPCGTTYPFGGLGLIVNNTPLSLEFSSHVDLFISLVFAC
jgi:hypothetical protein